MSKLERTLGALAAFVTIPTFGFFVYDRFWGDSTVVTAPADPMQPASGAAAAAPPPNATPAATDAGTQGASITSAPKAAPGSAPGGNLAPAVSATAAKPRPGLVFLCNGKQSATFKAGRNPNPALARFKDAPESAEAIFDFSRSPQSSTAEVLVRGPGSEWSAYSVAVQLAGQRGLYGAVGTNSQSAGLTFQERGEVNFETLEWSSNRVIRTASPRGPEAEVSVVGTCLALESPKPKPSDAPPQWRVEAKFIPMPR